MRGEPNCVLPPGEEVEADEECLVGEAEDKEGSLQEKSKGTINNARSKRQPANEIDGDAPCRCSTSRGSTKPPGLRPCGKLIQWRACWRVKAKDIRRERRVVSLARCRQLPLFLFATMD